MAYAELGFNIGPGLPLQKVPAEQFDLVVPVEAAIQQGRGGQQPRNCRQTQLWWREMRRKLRQLLLLRWVRHVYELRGFVRQQLLWRMLLLRRLRYILKDKLQVFVVFDLELERGREKM
jgi:hypothetical protein